MSRRWILGAVLGMVSVSAIGCQLLGPRGTSLTGLTGRIAFSRNGDLWVWQLPSTQTKLTSLPTESAITDVSWSPDGSQLVYSQFWRRPNDRAVGADLFVADADGSDTHLFAERDAETTILEEPQWTATGAVFYSVRRPQEGGAQTRNIVRQVPGGQPEVVLDNAYAPAVSVDGSTLVYVTSVGAGQALMKKSLGDADPGCELLSESVFQYLNVPRISPDGERVAIAGSGDPHPGSSSCGADNASKNASSLAGPEDASPPGELGPLLGLLPAAAYAHGLPFDVYTVNLDGGNLNRIAAVHEDDPGVAWSPDGAHVAVFGDGVLSIVDATGSAPTKLVDEGGYGTPTWAP